MKKILLSGGLIVAVAAVALGATYAAWSASTTIEKNTITTATLSLGKNGLIEKPIEGADAQNLLPGDYTNWGRAGIHNTSSVPLKLFLKVHITGNPNNVCDVTNLELWTGHAETPASQPNESDRQISDGSWTIAALAAGDPVELTGNPPFAELQANWTQVFWQRAQLDADANNSYQGGACEWTEEFIGETIPSTS